MFNAFGNVIIIASSCLFLSDNSKSIWKVFSAILRRHLEYELDKIKNAAKIIKQKKLPIQTKLTMK